MDTIFALASGQPPAGICVIRVSGPKVQQICTALIGLVPEPRRAQFSSIRDRNDEVIDQGLAIFFPAPRSFTGEDCVEFQLHGSHAVVQDMARLLSEFTDVRPALAGEFAQRAFMNGRFDLSEAEGLADLIDAETSEQRRLALRQSSGETSAVIYRWKDQLLEMRALLEASIDFADEDDIAQDVEARVATQSAAFLAEIDSYLAMVAPSEAIRRGLLVVLAGPPNAGKSSLFNALVGSDRVIVSSIAGTTRDFVEERLDLDGFLVRLVDTAGLRRAEDVIEVSGIERSRALLEKADVVVELSDKASFVLSPNSQHQTVLAVTTKADLASTYKDSLSVSIHDAASIVRLKSVIRDIASRKVDSTSGMAPINERQAGFLRELKSIMTRINFYTDPVEVRAEGLSRANAALGRIVGSHDVEDILGAVFSRFCVGK